MPKGKSKLAKDYARAFSLMSGKPTKVSKATKKFVKNAMDTHQELKHLGTVANGTALTSAISLTPISLIPQGDGSSERTGLIVKPTSIQGMIRVTRDDNAAADSYQLYRLAIIQWHMNSGDDAPDSLADFLYDSATIPAMSPFHVKKSLRDKFTVLWHYEGQLGTREAGAEGIPSSRIHRINIRKNMKAIGYNSGATSGIGNIYLMAYGDYTTTDDGVFDYSFLLRYRDKP